MAIKSCKKNKVKTCSIVNVIESTIARNSDWVLPIHAGIEIGVSSTKAIQGQLTVLYILCLKLAFVRKDIDENIYIKNISNLKKLPEAIDNCLKNEDAQNQILNERIEAQKKYKIQSTPTIFINDKIFDKISRKNKDKNLITSNEIKMNEFKIIS